MNKVEEEDFEDEIEEFPPLPNIEVGTELCKSEEGVPLGGTVIVMRITPPNPQTDTLEEACLQFLQDPVCEKWIMVREYAPKTKKLHYHFVVQISITDEQFRTELKNFFPELNSGHLYNLQISEDPLQALVYVLKDKGKYWSSGISAEWIDKCQKASYKKYSKEAFAKELDKLDTKFLCNLDKVNNIQKYFKVQEDYLTELSMLKASYNQNQNWNWSFAHSETMMIRRYGESYARHLVRSQMDKKYNLS